MSRAPPPLLRTQYFQVQVGARGSDALRFKGPIDCALKVVRAEGLKGLFRGANATVFRDTPAIGTYFAVYEGMKEYLERRWRLGEQASSFGAGGLAGAVSWLMIYPFDMVKSVQQVRWWLLVLTPTDCDLCCLGKRGGRDSGRGGEEGDDG